MSALAIVRDPGVLFVIAVAFLFLVGCAVHLWIKGNQVLEVERLRSQRVEPCDLGAAISEHVALRDRRLEARELGRAA